MSTDDVKSGLYWLYVVVALNQQYIITGAFLALAGVIALLLCLVLLSAISTYLLHRNAKPKEYPSSCKLLACKIEGTNHPYQYTQLHQIQRNPKTHERVSGTSDKYAKPFNPGKGSSLSRHFLSKTDGTRSSLTGGNRSTSQTSLDNCETVSYYEPYESGYTYESDQVTRSRGESGDYQPIRFQDDLYTRMDKYNSDDDDDDDYIVPKPKTTQYLNI